MSRIIETASGPVFVGSLDDDADLMHAASIATRCSGYSRDEDDECYVEGASPTCFNCRGRRWTADGFSCLKGLLAP